jgi:hypothetical protein
LVSTVVGFAIGVIRYVHSRVFRLVSTLVSNSGFDFQGKTNWFQVSLVSLLVSSATAAGSSDLEIRCNSSCCQCRSVVCSQSSSMTSSAKGSLLTYLASAKKSAMAKASESRCPPKSHVKPTPETMEKMDPGVAAVTIKAEKKRTVRSSKVPSTGDRPVDLYRQLAAALFLDREDSQWKDADINDLTDTVKNRVTK